MTEKSSGKSPVHKSVEMIPQPHGGALRRGGNTTPGTGRPPSAIRSRLRGAFDERVAVLEEIADGIVTINLREKCEHCGEMPTRQSPLELQNLVRSVTNDRLKAIDMMAKYGMGPGMSVDEVRDKVRATKAAADDILPPELAEQFTAELKRIWLGE